MTKKITFAVDAMGGEDSPKKIINGIKLFNKNNKDVYFKIFGNKNVIESHLNNFIDKNFFEIINTENQVVDTDSALGAAKKGKNTSMWLAIESVKNKESEAFTTVHIQVKKFDWLFLKREGHRRALIFTSQSENDTWISP